MQRKVETMGNKKSKLEEKIDFTIQQTGLDIQSNIVFLLQVIKDFNNIGTFKEKNNCIKAKEIIIDHVNNKLNSLLTMYDYSDIKELGFKTHYKSPVESLASLNLHNNKIEKTLNDIKEIKKYIRDSEVFRDHLVLRVYKSFGDRNLTNSALNKPNKQ
jgi:hypothetical protein